MLSRLLAPLKQLQQLPRDSRDTLFLLGVIALVILPQVAHLPLWCSALVALVLLWRGLLAWQSKPLPGRWWLFSLLGVTIIATLATHRTLLGRDAGVTLIVVLLALKTLELRAQRDAFVVFFLSFFCMLSNFFFSQSLLTACAMLLALLGLLTALVNAHMPVGRPPLLTTAKIAGKMALLGAPIMVVLFMLFPRLAPLWGVPDDSAMGRSGLSANMRVGTIAQLALDDSIAMRIKFAKTQKKTQPTQPKGSDIYLRGPVLTAFDGREWLPLAVSSRASANLRVSGPPIDYEVTLEPQYKPWVFVLDAAVTAPELANFPLYMTPDLQWLANRPISELVRYKAQSYLRFTHGPQGQHQNMEPSLQDAIDLPAGFNPRTLQLALEIRRDPRYAKADTATLVAMVMQRLRSGGYQYTLEPGLYGNNTADEFWFDKKAGFCEHIASSFVVLMRALDVPARVVTGYQGGEYNAVDGYWVVRQSDAHAWAEVWQAGSWARVDPTSAVAPQRINSLQRLAPPRGVFGRVMNSVLGNVWGTMGFNPLSPLRSVWEAVNNSWNQRVLNYTQATQFELLKNLGFPSPSWEDLSYVIIGLLVFASLCGSVWTLWDRRQHDPWLRLLASVQARLRVLGVNAPANTPPRELAELVKKRFGAPADTLYAWLIKLEAARYAKSTQAAHLTSKVRTLRGELKHLTWPKITP
ncbi:MAG: DUF3488 and transglutaminase-like domain-containing protein [Burkholderiaceae bacterium]|nr:DUF3488 and transglutaminase-like domain-containing protein [Burkholderiaceae bacterium]